MKSLFSSKNKRGQIALDVVEEVVMKLLILAVLGVAIILALTTLGNSNIFTSGSAGANSTTAITNNVSNAVTSFFGNAGTIFNILIAVVLISAVAIIILVVRRFAGGGSVSA
jgi:hypothetical protein